MNNRKKLIAKVLVFNAGLDAYGQPRKQGSFIRYISGIMTIYSHTKVEDVRYNDCQYIFLSDDDYVENCDQLEIDGKQYNVTYKIPSNRKQQYLLKEA